LTEEKGAHGSSGGGRLIDNRVMASFGNAPELGIPYSSGEALSLCRSGGDIFFTNKDKRRRHDVG
jgi:hypothetical protein